MRHRLAKATIVATIAALAVALPASAHQATIAVSCQTGINVDLSHYSGTDHVTIWKDDKTIADTDFHGSFTFHSGFIRTVAHTWRVKVDALPELSPDQAGAVAACEVPATTTVADSTTTTQPASTTSSTTSTTTTVAASTSTATPATLAPAGLPSVPPTNTPPTAKLPATGMSGAAIDQILAVGMVLVFGGYCLLRMRKPRRHPHV